MERLTNLEIARLRTKPEHFIENSKIKWEKKQITSKVKTQVYKDHLRFEINILSKINLFIPYSTEKLNCVYNI